MIISHKHRFIFLHCRKAAGSSVVSSLSRYLGPEDLQFSAIMDGARAHIYPPRRVIVEGMRSLCAKDVIAVLTFKRSFWSAISHGVKKRYSIRMDNQSPAHAPARVVAKTFTDEWEKYFKFCIVRNPWDKTLSDYFWRTKNLVTPPSFDEFVESLEDGKALPGITPTNHQNWDMYTINDHIAVDCVVRFEDMRNGLKTALSHTSVQWDGWLPHMKNGSQSNQRKYQPYYSHHTTQLVARLYEKEIKAFNYDF